MSNTVLILGETGSGKSTGIKTLNPEETFIINVRGKPLPFSGWKTKYRYSKIEDKNINMVQTDKKSDILNILMKVNEAPHIKTVVIDDFQYLMSNEFMRRASEIGYQKFTEIAFNAWSILDYITKMRPDITIFVLSHLDTDDKGKSKIKTIGKMLDEKITIEGMFTVVLYCEGNEDGHFLRTKTNFHDTCKAPDGMFSETLIENSYQKVLDAINKYEN